MSGRRILLGVTGGIAAYKSADLVRRLQDRGAQVRVVMTRRAHAFVTPLTFQAVSGNTVHTDLLDAAAEAAKAKERAKTPSPVTPGTPEVTPKKLSTLQRRWLEAEFGGKIELGDGAEKVFVENVKKGWSPPIGKKVGMLMQQLGLTGNPRTKDQRLTALHSAACQQ